MIVCTVIFLYAGTAQTEVCRYVTHRYPDGPAVLDDTLEAIQEYASRFADNNETLKILSARPFSVLLTKCANESLVDSLGDEVVGMVVSDNVSFISSF